MGLTTPAGGPGAAARRPAAGRQKGPVTVRAVPPGAATAPGRRERKKLATRAAVREAALRLALRHGVANVTVEQIATEADIAVRTFFNHFGSKEEAIVAAAAAGAEALIAEFRARPRTEPVLWALRQAVLAVLDRDDEATRACIRAMWLITRSPSLVPHQLGVLAAQERALADAITERLGPRAAGGVYPRLCAATALTALRVALHDWLQHATGPDATPPVADLRDRVDRVIAELAAGLDRPAPAAR